MEVCQTGIKKIVSRIGGKKKLGCPVCGFKRLIDADENNESELIAEEQMPDGWHPDYFQKCPQCKKQIGIRKVG